MGLSLSVTFEGLVCGVSMNRVWVCPPVVGRPVPIW